MDVERKRSGTSVERAEEAGSCRVRSFTAVWYRVTFRAGAGRGAVKKQRRRRAVDVERKKERYISRKKAQKKALAW